MTTTITDDSVLSLRTGYFLPARQLASIKLQAYDYNYTDVIVKVVLTCYQIITII